MPKLGHHLPRGLSAEDAERLLAAVRRLKYRIGFEEKRNFALVSLMLFT